MNVLSKGFNFASSHSDKDVLQFIAAVEPAIEDIEDVTQDEKSAIRQRIVSSLNAAQKNNNLTVEDRQAIKRLKSDNDITIAKADKGN